MVKQCHKHHVSPLVIACSGVIHNAPARDDVREEIIHKQMNECQSCAAYEMA